MNTQRIAILLSTIIFSIAKAERYISPSPGNLFLLIEIEIEIQTLSARSKITTAEVK